MQKGDHILYYDLNHGLNGLRYSTYFVNGFQDHAAEGTFTFSRSKVPPPLLSAPGMEDGRDILFSVGLFKAALSGESFYFCIDTRDSGIAAGSGKGYHLPLLEKVRYYFKVNYNAEAVGDDPRLLAHASKIIPALSFFEVRPNRFATLFSRITLQRLRTLARWPTLDALRRRRELPKNVDIFFIVKFYDPGRHAAENEFRYQVMREILRIPGVTSRVGFTSAEPLPGKYAAFRVDPLPLDQYLDGLARSRVAIYVRGLHGCLSFKFGQMLALGLPIAGQTLLNNTENILKLGRLREQFSHEDPATIAQGAAGLLKNEDALRGLGAANARTFDQSLTPRAVVGDILENLSRERS